MFSIGEEEEKAVFAYRAKLFRFDGDANQWKEKGLGEMKILQHKENGNHYSTVTSGPSCSKLTTSLVISNVNITNTLLLAHLSRRLIGELIVYPCSGVRPSSSTISKIFSETAGPIVLILHIHHLQVGGKNNCVFCFDRIRTLVAMATYASHRLTMEKSENCQFLLSCWRYLNFVFAEMFIE